MTIPEFCRRGVAAQRAVDAEIKKAKPQPRKPAQQPAPIITGASVLMDAPGHWTYRLFDAKGHKRFEGGAKTFFAALEQTAEYARQIESGAIGL